MGFKCSNTARFSSYSEESDVQDSGHDVSDGQVTGSVQVTLLCNECDEEVAQKEFEWSIEPELEDGQDLDTAEVDITVEPYVSSEVQLGKSGKPKKHQMMVYGAQISVHLTFENGDEKDVETTVSAPAPDYESVL